MLDSYARHTVQPAIEGGAIFFRSAGLTANKITWAAMLIGVGSGAVLTLGCPVAAVVMLWISGYLDAVDGTLARMTKPSRWGTILDITFDRVVEGGLLIALLLVNAEAYLPIALNLAAILVTITIFLVTGNVIPNTGAKGFHYNPGLLERTEAFVFVTLMILVPNLVWELAWLFFALLLLTIMKHLRDVYVWLGKNNID
ncbi:CDP-alcohol phosphatidyltransferase family protein [Paenibacillus sp. BC26]|uniref:CDP-alcohol phosphatidyltransferase family protein n=1 Tax=Paenibacillus sp. BC26 TaxID=1881032 RepID=UPI0008E46237|nr:CDP-alcohol phosphatidyltransferase family protein [Paenibacillus sp. BC26]SFT13325.1 Phosphatidylglycerophosphate synthase [Paenibacillus sp. BC26]